MLKSLHTCELVGSVLDEVPVVVVVVRVAVVTGDEEGEDEGLTSEGEAYNGTKY